MRTYGNILCSIADDKKESETEYYFFRNLVFCIISKNTELHVFYYKGYFICLFIFIVLYRTFKNAEGAML